MSTRATEMIMEDDMRDLSNALCLATLLLLVSLATKIGTDISTSTIRNSAKDHPYLRL
jgi:hypothetical protein